LLRAICAALDSTAAADSGNHRRWSSDRIAFLFERMGTLSGKIALGHGGGSGIGQGAAVELARAAATVVVSGRRASALAETEALIKQAAAKGKPRRSIPATSRPVVRASAAILARHGRIDILVNCAGTNVPKRFFKDLDAAEWDRVVGINLNGALYCTLACCPRCASGATVW